MRPNPSNTDVLLSRIGETIIPTREALLADLSEHLRSGVGFAVATVNLDHLVKLRRDDKFRSSYGKHSHIVADGNPVVWLQSITGHKVELVPGSDLIFPLVELAGKLGIRIALLGSTRSSLDLAAERLVAAFSKLQIVAKIAPQYGFDPDGAEADECLFQLRSSEAGLCLLALGAPKQEIFAARALEKMPGVGFVSIGAGLDFIAGTQVRAPLWVRRIAMEWLWRLSANPRRLVKRYWNCAVFLPNLIVSACKIRIRTRSEIPVTTGHGRRARLVD